MKKLLLSTFIVAGFIANAQTIPNAGFENWGASLGQPQEPTNYVTANILASPFVTFPLPNTNPTSVTQGTLAGEFHGGTKAMKLSTVLLTSNPLASSGVPDTIGWALTGIATITPVAGLTSGFQFTSRATTFSFWYRYTPVGTDHAFGAMYLTKWIGAGVRDTVAKAEYLITGSSSTFSQVNVNFVYTPAYASSGTPDSATVVFASSFGTLSQSYVPRPNLGSILWADDVDVVLPVGVNENKKNTVEIKAYPNPAINSITISSNSESAELVELYDVTGKKVLVDTFEDKKARFNTDNLSNGLYIYLVKDRDKKTLSSGKVNVSK